MPSHTPACVHMRMRMHVCVQDGLMPCIRRFPLRFLITTWNVGEIKPDVTSIRTWLGTAGAAHADVVMVALQETVMSAGTVAMDAAFATFAKAQLVGLRGGMHGRCTTQRAWPCPDVP